MEVELCGLEVAVGLSDLRHWEQKEGGKLILKNTYDLYFSDEVAILYTTLSARRPSTQTHVVAPAPALADPWSDLASRFLARNFQPLTAAERAQLLEQGRPSHEVDQCTHIHLKSGQCHPGPRFAAAAVSAYQEFLRLKTIHVEAVCQVWLDEVWHTHLQDVDAYQRDCAALLGSGALIEHSPLPPSESMRRYRTTYAQRRDAQQGAPADEYELYFWPEPKATEWDEKDDFSIERVLDEDNVVCG